MKSKAILPTLLILVCLGIGCSSIDPVSGREYPGYLPSRAYDFMDMFELNVGVDAGFPSLYMSLIVGEPFPLTFGGGLFEAEKFGIDGRLAGQWREKRCELNLCLLGSLVSYEKEPHWGNRYLFDGDYCPLVNDPCDEERYFSCKKGIWGKEIWADYDFTNRVYDHERRFGDLSFELHCACLGFEIGFSPVEMMDFITGIFGCDVICDDDWVKPMPKRQIPLFEDTPKDEEKDEAAVLIVE